MDTDCKATLHKQTRNGTIGGERLTNFARLNCTKKFGFQLYFSSLSLPVLITRVGTTHSDLRANWATRPRNSSDYGRKESWKTHPDLPPRPIPALGLALQLLRGLLHLLARRPRNPSVPACPRTGTARTSRTAPRRWRWSARWLAVFMPRPGAKCSTSIWMR